MPHPKITTNRFNLQSHALSQTYGAILPTSLTYIVLSARGCSPWRPAAVIGTTRSGWTLDPVTVARPGSASFGFQGPSVATQYVKGLRMKLRCSSRFRALSRSESNSRALWSMTSSGRLRRRVRRGSPGAAILADSTPPVHPHDYPAVHKLSTGPPPAFRRAGKNLLGGKEISSRDHVRYPKGRFSVAAI